MKLKTFFEKFDLFADAPDAVAKMRELVLELAVTGKLVAQDASDEPASRLLCRIDAERVQMVRAKKIRHRDLLGPISESDIPFPVPEGWEWRHLADVTFLITDGAHHTPQYQEKGVPFLSVKDVSSGTIDFSNTRYITPDAHRELCKRCQPERGDILLTKVGTTGIAVTVDDSREFSIFVSLALLKFSKANLDGQFLKYLINSPFVKKQSAENTQGIGNKNLVLRLINLFKVPLPPLAEQKRIVAKVDELMALCDRLEAQQQEREQKHAALARASLARFAYAPTPANLNYIFHSSFNIQPSSLRKSILTLAVQGLLVPHDPESADWESRKLKDLTTKIGSGSTPSGGKESYQESGVPLIRSMNVHFGGFVRHGLAFLNAEQAEKLKNVTVKADDVLLNITGASIGRVATAPKDMEGARVNQHVCILRPTAEIIPPFLVLFLASPVVQDLIDNVQVGATREALTKAMIEQFEIPLPPLAEQCRIVAKVDELMALVDELETQLAACRATGEKLLVALVAELTAGKESHAAA